MVAPLRSPAVDELEHAVPAVESHDADGVAPEKLATRLGHRDNAAGCIHEPLVHHDAGDEAVRHQIRLHLDDTVEPRVALGAIRGGRPPLLRRRWYVDALDVVRHAVETADTLLLDDFHRLANRHPFIGGVLASLAIDIERRELVVSITERPVMLETLLKGLVVVGGGARNAGPGRPLVEDRRQRGRVIHLFGERRRLQEGRDAVIAVVVGVLDAAERVSRHRECDERAAISRWVRWSDGPGEFASPCALRAEPNRRPAPGRGTNRALQLPVRPSPGWAVPAADRGH